MTPSTGGRPLWHRFRLAIGPLSRYPRHPWQAFLNVGLASGCEFAARRDTVKRPSIRRGGHCRDRVDAVVDPLAEPLAEPLADRAITQSLILSCGPMPPSYMSQGKSALGLRS